MKVAIVTAFPSEPLTPRGGVEAVSVCLVKALAKFDDLELEVVTTDPQVSSCQVSEWEGLTVHRLPRLGWKALTGCTHSGRRQMHRYLGVAAPDVVHAHDVYGLMASGLAIPKVLTIHGFIHADTLIEPGRVRRLRSYLWQRCERETWADYAHIISISPYVRERLRGIVKGVIHDIDNPVSEAFFGLGGARRRGTVFSAGLMSPRKNTCVLIEALGRLVGRGVDVELRLAGAAVNSEYARRVDARISELGLTGRVTCLGQIDALGVQRELATASVYALVSLEENSPVAIEEAMAAGLPVVTSNRCGMPYMVRNGENGYLVNPLDPEDIAWRLGQLLEDDGLRAQMGEKSRQVALDRFHPEVVARRTREVYYRVLHDAGKTRGGR